MSKIKLAVGATSFNNKIVGLKKPIQPTAATDPNSPKTMAYII
jgi:hypothetical protein